MERREKSVNNKTVNEEKTERDKIRWTMVVYDTIVYLLCWNLLFVLQPAVACKISNLSAAIYILLGYVIFFGCRLLRKCYKQIWRYGSIHAFSGEFYATALATLLFVAVGLLVRNMTVVDAVPFTFLLSVAAFYVVISLMMRFVYYNAYCFANRDTLGAQVMRRILERIAFVDFESKTPGATLHFALEKIKPADSPINELQKIAESFMIRGEITGITQINKGYINRTYCVDTLSENGHVHKYTMQRINTNVFPDVDALMDNFKLTTDHLYGRLHLPANRVRGSVHSLRATKDGAPYLKDDSGCWRMLTYFDDVYSLDIPDCAETFYQADRKSTRLNSSHDRQSRMPSSA